MTIPGILAGLCALALACVPLEARADAGQPLTVEQWREDVRFLARELARRHRDAFHATKREELDAAFKSLEESLPSLAPHQIVVALAQIVAKVGDGHTQLALGPGKVKFHRYPILLYPFADGLFVRAADPRHADAVGARVLRIGLKDPDAAVLAAASVLGRDNEMTVRWRVSIALGIAEVLHAVGVAERTDRVDLVIEKDGRRRTLTLEAEPMRAASFHGWHVDPRWIEANAGAPTPLWLKNPHENFWYEYLADRRTVYVQYNAVVNKADETVGAFFDRVFDFVDRSPVDRLVFDLRLNGGGNNFLNVRPFHRLMRSPVNQRGKLFVVVGRQTFSAAQNMVNLLERFTDAIFVGEPTGASPNHYGDAVRVVLPHSEVPVFVSTLWWQDMDPRDTRPWQAPDIAAELTSAEYGRGVDPAMEAILAYGPRASIEERVRAAVEKGDFAGARSAVESFRAEPANKYAVFERELNALGYALLNERSIDAAVEVFKINAETYPDSFNVHDSLGEAYVIRGDRDLAIRSYQRSLELNPDNAGAVHALERLRGR